MKTLLICHEGASLDREGLARWLGSFSDLVGLIVLREQGQHIRRRVRREVERVGILRFPDVLAFRAYYRIFLAKKDRAWEQQKLRELRSVYREVPNTTPVLIAFSPNSPEAEEFIRQLRPDIMVARCKFLLKERVFSIPTIGTLVMHPGICPEYRNAHGCFWALANNDLQKIGMTLLRIDNGVDTGPVYGYYSYKYDELHESHIVIQHRVVLDNLDDIKMKLLEINSGAAVPLDTSGRPSGTWGQPQLTRYLKWKYKARKRAHESHFTSLSRCGQSRRL